MEFGISLFPTDTSASPVEVAVEAEARGFSAFWVSEHSHMPIRTDFPLGEDVPREYASMFDPFVALSAAAVATSTIRLGTAIVILPQHDPINCAKAVASIDHISEGRMLFGIGAGWNEPELRNHGTDPGNRFKLMRERIEAMKALWTEEVAEYHGDLVEIEASWQWPKPVQRPHPPVLVAGAGPNVIRRVVRYGDGWLPVVVPEATAISPGRMTPISELQQRVPHLRALAAEHGRSAPRVIVSGHFDRAAHAIYQDLNVDGVAFRVPSENLDSVKRAMDQIEQQIRAVGGALS